MYYTNYERTPHLESRGVVGELTLLDTDKPGEVIRKVTISNSAELSYFQDKWRLIYKTVQDNYD